MIFLSLSLMAVAAVMDILSASTIEAKDQNRSFTISYDQNSFVKDGKPFRYISGSMHYFRVPAYYWRDRMEKMWAAGFNTLQTYVEWSQHEPFSGHYDFSGNLDLLEYLRIANEMGLLVILRPGPYICAERDMGGLPFWLLQADPSMTLRSSDPVYLKFVDRWFGQLLPLLKPYMYSNGGPVIMVQVENEYGSYFACDQNYTAHLRDLLHSYLGEETLLFTTDGDEVDYLQCGKVDNVYATVDFGTDSNVTEAFDSQRQYEPRGPLVNSEFYAGWLDNWQHPHAHVEIDAVVATLDHMLAMNASVNVYMAHGGTNFGFTSGAEGTPGPKYYHYNACPTSYDYDAPISEAGDPSPKLAAIQEVIQKYFPTPDGNMPGPTPKASYGKVDMHFINDIFELRSFLSPQPIHAQYPLGFEEVGLRYGYMLYGTRISGKFTDPTLLSVPGLRDRGYVFLDKELVGTLSRTEDIFNLPLVLWKQKHRLHIMVENQGRICYGTGIKDFKGIISNVTLGGQILTKWTMWPFLFNNTQQLVKYVDHMLALTDKRILQHATAELNKNKGRSQGRDGVEQKPEQYKRTTGMAMFAGSFILPERQNTVSFHPRDTFLRLDGWSKGIVFINDFNLGRYWPVVGPQITLFVPKTVLRPYPRRNVITVFEQEHAPCSHHEDTHTSGGEHCSVEFVAWPDINGPTPQTRLKEEITAPQTGLKEEIQML